MRKLLRDLVVAALGMNLALIGCSAAMGNKELLWLGVLSAVSCGVALSIGAWLDDEEERLKGDDK